MDGLSTSVPVTFDPDAWPACWVLDMIARTGCCAEFYTSSLWRRKRAAVKREQRHQCWCHLHPADFQFLRGQSPALVAGDTVHHVNPLRQRPDLALSDKDETGRQNLICVCASCHWQLEHPQAPTIDVPERW